MDTFYTLAAQSKAVFTEKRSRFLSFAIPVNNRDEVRDHVKWFQKEYFDARHVCYAFVLGADRADFLANDNGEPSGTAGRPILGQINAASLTNLLIVVVRYFGGIKLGTPGLIAAYKEAARLAIEEGSVIECHRTEEITVTFPYLAMNDVMKIVKSSDAEVLHQQFDNVCEMSLRLRADRFPAFSSRLLAVDGVTARQ